MAAGLGLLVPSAADALAIDILLALLVFVTALDIDPLRLLQVRRRMPLILLVAVIPLAVASALAAGAFGHGATQVAGVYGAIMLVVAAALTSVVRRRLAARA